MKLRTIRGSPAITARIAIGGMIENLYLNEGHAVTSRSRLGATCSLGLDLETYVIAFSNKFPSLRRGCSGEHNPSLPY